MAIAGILVHAMADDLERLEVQIKGMPEMSTYGIHQDQYIVVVAEDSAERLKATLERMQKLDGVLSVYITYVNIEDERQLSVQA